MQVESYREDRARSEELFQRVRVVVPWATRLLLGLNAAVWVLLWLLPEEQGLIVLMSGALIPGSVLAGEPLRLLSSLFFHFDVVHLALNLFALWLLGRFSEAIWGRLPMLIVYFAAGLGSGLASMAFLPTSAAMGASGCIFGLLGLVAGTVLLQRDQLPWLFVQRLMLSRLILAVIIGTFATGLLAPVLSQGLGLELPPINNPAHAGGLVTGVILSFLLTPSGGTFRRPLSMRISIAVLLAVSLGALGAEAWREARATMAYSNTRWYRLHEAGRLEDAARVLEQSVARTPQDPWERLLKTQALNNLAWTWLELDRELDRAHALAAEAVELEPERPSYIDTLAFVEAIRGDCGRAQELMETAAALDATYGLRRREVESACSEGRRPDLETPFGVAETGPSESDI